MTQYLGRIPILRPKFGRRLTLHRYKWVNAVCICPDHWGWSSKAGMHMFQTVRLATIIILKKTYSYTAPGPNALNPNLRTRDINSNRDGYGL